MEHVRDIVKMFKRKPWEWIKFSRPWKKTALDNEREGSAWSSSESRHEAPLELQTSNTRVVRKWSLCYFNAILQILKPIIEALKQDITPKLQRFPRIWLIAPVRFVSPESISTVELDETKTFMLYIPVTLCIPSPWDIEGWPRSVMI